MGWTLSVLVSMVAALVIVIALWRRAEGLRADSEADYAALVSASRASMDAAEEVRGVLESQEEEIKSLQATHNKIKKSLKEVSEEIDRSSGSPAKIAGLWNKTFSGEK